MYVCVFVLSGYILGCMFHLPFAPIPAFLCFTVGGHMLFNTSFFSYNPFECKASNVKHWYK